MKNKKIKLAETVNLTFVGKNEEGEDEFIGTEKQWTKFDNLLNKNL